MKPSVQNTIRAATYFMAGAIALCALQVTARAADDSVPSLTVRYADLDISKPAGAKVLYGRIVAAAHQVCMFDGSSRLAVLELKRACVSQAIDNAVRDVDSPALSALHSSGLIHLASK